MKKRMKNYADATAVMTRRDCMPDNSTYDTVKSTHSNMKNP